MKLLLYAIYVGLLIALRVLDTTCPELKTTLATMKMDDASVDRAKLYLHQQVNQITLRIGQNKSAYSHSLFTINELSISAIWCYDGRYFLTRHWRLFNSAARWFLRVSTRQHQSRFCALVMVGGNMLRRVRNYLRYYCSSECSESSQVDVTFPSHSHLIISWSMIGSST